MTEFPTIEKIIEMVESCTTTELEELSNKCKERSDLFTMMIELTINHELEKRGIKDYRQDISLGVITKE